MITGISTHSAGAEGKWSAALREAGLLLLIALAATAASWMLRSDGLPLTADPVAYELELPAPLTEIGEALARYEEGDFLFVDTRPRTGEDFDTIPGAFLIQESSFDDDLLSYFDFMTPEDHLILFGDGDLLQVSSIATRLLDRGYPNLLILKGGLSAWRGAGGEISQRKGDRS
jgi:rhodanese-related sulfurtransferase